MQPSEWAIAVLSVAGLIWAMVWLCLFAKAAVGIIAAALDRRPSALGAEPLEAANDAPPDAADEVPVVKVRPASSP